MFDNITTVAESNLTDLKRSSGNQLCSLLKQVQTGNDIAFTDFRALCAFLSFVNVFVAVIAILGNAVVFAVFYRYESLRTASNLLLLGLSFCDFFVGFVTQPLFAAETVLVAANSGVACSLKDLYVIFLFAFSSFSMLHVCLISIERFFAIFYPFKHQIFLTMTRTVIFLVMTWISWTFIAIFTRRKHGGGIIGYSRMGFVIFSAFLMLVLNLRLWIEARRHFRQIQSTLPSQSVSGEPDNKGTRAKAETTREFKAAKTILRIIGILILYNLLLVAAFTARKFYGVRNTIVMLPTVLNPVVYCWRKRDIRISVKRMFGCHNRGGVQRQENHRHSRNNRPQERLCYVLRTKPFDPI